MGDVGDDHFHDFVWETLGRFARNTCLWWPITEQAVDLGFTSSPNDHHAIRDVYPYDTIGAGVRAIRVHLQGNHMLSAKDIVTLSNLHL